METINELSLIEKQFKIQFIASYCAVWIGRHEDEACFRGDHEKLHHPPIEDAVFLAEKSWEEFLELGYKDYKKGLS